MATSLFQSRFSRRLLLLFVGCALAPMGVLAALVLTHTTAQLERQSQVRLHQGSKAIGLAILERLSLLEGEARLVAERFERTAEGPAVLAGAEGHFTALALIGPDAAVTPLLGSPPAIPELDADQRRHLARNGAVLVTRGEEAGAGRILLVVPLEERAQHERVVASLNVEHVVVPASVRTDGEGSEYCLLGPEGAPVACSLTGTAGLPEILRGSNSGALSFKHQGETYLADRWSLFLKARFAAPPWDVVLAEPRSLVTAPMEAFKRSLVLVVIGSMLCVMLLSLGQIRRNLVPLQRLRSGARRIARREFDARVEVTSRDEFQEVADAFNGMAETLGHQFTALVTMDEIDRAVLSSLESAHIVETVLIGLADVQRCDAVGFVLLDAGQPERGMSRVRPVATGQIGPEQPVTLDKDDLDSLRRNDRTFTLEASAELPAYLQPMVEAGMYLLQVLPVMVGGEPRGVLVIAHAEAPMIVAEAPTFARQIADQVAVALANADMIGEIRELNRTLEEKVRARTAELSDAMEQLRETQARLVHREKMASVGQLVAGVAHEINNPLNFIQGNIKFLHRYRKALTNAIADYESALSPSPQAVAEIREQYDLDFVIGDLASIVEACGEGVVRTTAIVADLQSFSRLDGGDCRQADLHELLDSTVSILASRLTNIELQREYGPIPPVECLAGQISQVFMNLIVNAADAVGESGQITVRTSQPDPDTVRIEIEDDGCGIEEELRERIFDPFFTTKEVGQGTGLGLAITFGVVTRHSGRIQLESEVGRGTRFQVDLPVKFSAPNDDSGDEQVLPAKGTSS